MYSIISLSRFVLFNSLVICKEYYYHVKRDQSTENPYPILSRHKQRNYMSMTEVLELLLIRPPYLGRQCRNTKRKVKRKDRESQ